jgi:hypothetical protein
VQTLMDGNRIVNSTTTRMYRDGQGRTRTEMVLPSLHLTSGPTTLSVTSPSIVTINDPVAGETYMLNSDAKTASKMAAGPKGAPGWFAVRDNPGIVTAGPGPQFAQQIKISDEGNARGHDVSKEDLGTQQIQKEDLGTQQIEGVNVTGTRYTSTIPAGAIGNEQPIQTVSETWYAPDLKIVLKSTNSDPRTGETTVTVKDLNRAEPDPSLFQVPSDYTITDSKNGQFLFKSAMPLPNSVSVH